MKPSRRVIFALLLAALTGCGASIPNLQSQIQQTLYEPCGPAMYYTEVVWSPDGLQLAYVAGSSDIPQDIYIANLATGITTQITDTPSDELDLAWSPDGTRLLFMQRDGGQPYGPFLVYTDGTGLNDLVDSNGLGEVMGDYAWSPDGSMVAISAELRVGGLPLSESPGLYLLRLADETVTLLIPGIVYRPAWSPDGTQIAYVARFIDAAGQEVYDLMAADSDGSNVRRLASGLDQFGEVAWSPDGTRIAFLSGSTYASLWLHVVNADGAGYLTLEGTYWVQDFIWLPDGEQLLYYTEIDDVIAISADGRSKTVLRNISLLRDLCPDGTYAAQVGSQPPNWEDEVTVEFIDASPPRQLTRNPANQLCLKWP